MSWMEGGEWCLESVGSRGGWCDDLLLVCLLRTTPRPRFVWHVAHGTHNAPPPSPPSDSPPPHRHHSRGTPHRQRSAVGKYRTPYPLLSLAPGIVHRSTHQLAPQLACFVFFFCLILLFFWILLLWFIRGCLGRRAVGLCGGVWWRFCVLFGLVCGVVWCAEWGCAVVCSVCGDVCSASWTGGERGFVRMDVRMGREGCTDDS